MAMMHVSQVTSSTRLSKEERVLVYNHLDMFIYYTLFCVHTICRLLAQLLSICAIFCVYGSDFLSRNVMMSLRCYGHMCIIVGHNYFMLNILVEFALCNDSDNKHLSILYFSMLSKQVSYLKICLYLQQKSSLLCPVMLARLIRHFSKIAAILFWKIIEKSFISFGFVFFLPPFTSEICRRKSIILPHLCPPFCLFSTSAVYAALGRLLFSKLIRHCQYLIMYVKQVSYHCTQ